MGILTKTLDEQQYAEGTMTPVFVSQNGITGINGIASHDLRYVRHGKRVHISGWLIPSTSAVDTWAAGDAIRLDINSLPYAPEIQSTTPIDGYIGTFHMYDSYGGVEVAGGPITTQNDSTLLWLYVQSLLGAPSNDKIMYVIFDYITSDPF